MEERRKGRKRKRDGQTGTKWLRPVLLPKAAVARQHKIGAGRPIVESAEPPCDAALETPDGVVWVEGRVAVPGWDAEKRAAVAALERAAKVLGLMVFDVAGASARTPVRRRWANSSVDLDVAVAEVRDHPGITFLDWVKALYLAGVDPNAITGEQFYAAKARAANAMSRLVRTGRLVKRKNVEGVLCLWLPSAEPR